MKEQFVTYEIAKQLKEKGFDEPCFGLYNIYETYGQYGIINIGDLHLTNVNRGFKSDNAIIAPLWQQVIDWLEEKLDIAIWIEWDNETFIWTWNILHRECKWSNMDNCVMGWDWKSEARQRAIEYALTLI